MSFNHSKVFIEIKNAYVEGIDTYKRAQGLKHFFLNRGTSFSPNISILRNISFSCYEGEKIAFIGSNGSGKSSLLKMIAGIYPPIKGTINVSGDIAPIIDMGVGFEQEQTGRDNIKMLMLYNNMLDKYNKEIEREIIDFSELGSKIDLPIKNYSSGMLARLAFSISIFQDPQILLLDEIFATGDSCFVEKSLKLMKNKFRNTPISIIVTHQENIVKENCTRCILLRDGNIVGDGKPSEIFKIYMKKKKMIKYFLSKKYWEAVILLVKASIIRQNKDSFLGSLWSLIQPFINILVISYFFGFLLHQPREFLIMNLVGGMPLWTFILSSLTISSNSLVTRDQVIKKVRISKTFFPVADTLAQLYNLFCSFLAMYCAFILLFPEKFTWQIIFMPILILPLIICTISGSIAMAFLTPYIRDIPQILNVVLGVIYWSIPIIYPYSLIPEAQRDFFELNPFFIIIRPAQSLVIDGTLPDLLSIGKSVLVAFITVCISYLVYKRFSKRVIYYL